MTLTYICMITFKELIKNASYIYKITNIFNNKVYIGQTKNKYKKRWSDHKSSLRNNKHGNDHLQKAWNKYGEESFVFELIDTVVFSESLNNLERFWINYYDSMNPFKGYNKKGGGNLSGELSEETRLKMSISKKGKPSNNKFTPETRRLLSESASKRRWSEEMKCYFSKTRKGKYNGNEETGKKISKALKGRKVSDTTKKQISLNMPHKKTIICLNNGQIFKSVHEACRELNLPQSNLSAHLNGRRPSVKGYVFKFL